MTALAGRLRERVTVSRLNGARDALGGGANWETIGAAWAGFSPDGRGAAVAGDAIAARARWAVTLRPCDLLPGDRIVHGASAMRVLGVTRDPARPDRIVATAEDLA